MGRRHTIKLAFATAYLILLGLSHISQWGRTQERLPGQEVAELPVMRAGGPVENAPPVELAYTDAGAGDVVVFLHGSPGAGSNFARLAPRVTSRYRAISPDLPGFGASTRRIPDYSIRAHARYVLALLDRLEIARAHLFGFSMGSGVALELYDLAPERVASMIFYGGIGVQEGEGSGDYAFEQLKYRAAWLGLVALPEVVPHFGRIGLRSSRAAFVRNFMDTDQRPLRGILERLDVPLLILHGRRDPLVPPWTAEEHHRLVERSELVMFDASHFMVFFPEGVSQLSGELLPFLDARSAGVPTARRTVDHSDGRRQHRWPVLFSRDDGPRPWARVAATAIVQSAFEEAALVGGALLVADDQLDFFVVMVGLWIGAFVSQVAIYGFGRARVWPTRFGAWVVLHPWLAALATRLVPGLRVLVLMQVGANRMRGFWWRWALVQLFGIALLVPIASSLAGLLG